MYVLFHQLFAASAPFHLISLLRLLKSSLALNYLKKPTVGFLQFENASRDTPKLLKYENYLCVLFKD